MRSDVSSSSKCPEASSACTPYEPFHASQQPVSRALDLALTALKPAVIHPGPDGDGLVYYSPQDVSYYYSYTRLAAGGTLTIDGKETAASGTVWMDHQWGDFQIDPAGWDWFSLHLDDGTELMLATVRGDEVVKTGLGTYVDAEGSATAVTAEVTPLDRVLAAFALHIVESAIDDPFGNRLLAVLHQAVHEPGQNDVTVFGIGENIAFFCCSAS